MIHTSDDPGSDAVSVDAAYQRLQRPLIGLATLLTGSRATAEEVVHDVFAAAIPRWDTIEEPSPDEIATAEDDVACKASTGLLQMASDLHDAYGHEAAARAPEIVTAHREYLDHALGQAAAFENGTLTGPWRASPSADALHNSAECVWLPDDVGTIDMSVGDRGELASYLDSLTSAEQRDAEVSSATTPESASIEVPPWLIGMSTCVSNPTVDDLTGLRSTLPG